MRKGDMLSKHAYQIHLEGGITILVTRVKSLILVFLPKEKIQVAEVLLSYCDCVKLSIKADHSRVLVKCERGDVTDIDSTVRTGCTDSQRCGQKACNFPSVFILSHKFLLMCGF